LSALCGQDGGPLAGEAWLVVDDIEALLLRHEAELPTIMRAVIRVLRAQVEACFGGATTREQLLVGATILRMLLSSIERKCL
jgi:hypothetical protein